MAKAASISTVGVRGRSIIRVGNAVLFERPLKELFFGDFSSQMGDILYWELLHGMFDL